MDTLAPMAALPFTTNEQFLYTYPDGHCCHIFGVAPSVTTEARLGTYWVEELIGELTSLGGRLEHIQGAYRG